MESTQQSLEKRYDDYLRQHHGGMAPLSFEMWKEQREYAEYAHDCDYNGTTPLTYALWKKAQVQCWWIHRPKTEVFRFTGTRTLLEDKLKLCEVGTRWGYYDNGVHITLGEKMSPEEHFDPINNESKRAVITFDNKEIRIFVYHDSDRLSVSITKERAQQLAYELLGYSLR